MRRRVSVSAIFLRLSEVSLCIDVEKGQRQHFRDHARTAYPCGHSSPASLLKLLLAWGWRGWDVC
jgi:hypothetical protein